MNLGDRAELERLRGLFRTGLVEDCLPFWLEHGLDREHGGIITSLGRRGEILETDKSVWFQGRAAWTFSTAYLQVEPKPEWLEAARSCLRFLEERCFDVDGRMFFRVTREGLPVIKRRRYVFSETFAIAAMAAFSRASGEGAYARKGLELLDRVLLALRTPGILEPKFNPATRDADGLALHMILVATAQELRLAFEEGASGSARPDGRPAADAEAVVDRLTSLIESEIRAIETKFMKPELRCVLEQVGPGGEFLREHFEGRMLNPGHAIEAAWFVLREARERKAAGGAAARAADRAARRGAPLAAPAAIERTGLEMLDWMWDWGWDREHGGIIYFRDALGLPGVEYWHDMKFWWPQNEAIVACLMAYAMTGERRWEERFTMALDWAFARFPDPEHGEWFGYLHRDGTVATELKGNLYKGPFHIPRMHLVCLGLVEELARGR